MPDPNTIPEHFELPNTAGVYNEFFTEFNEMRIDEYDKGKKKSSHSYWFRIYYKIT